MTNTERTPSIGDIREAWWRFSDDKEGADASFDRWLAAHDAGARPSEDWTDGDKLIAAVLAYGEEHRKQGHMNSDVHQRAMRAALVAAGSISA